MSLAKGLPGVGDTLGNFQVVRLLGQGGHAAVFEARQERLDRQVALKVLLPHVVETLKGVEKRFLREIDLVKRLEHPNAVRLYDFGKTDDGLLWMAVELVKGPELAEVLHLHGRLSPQRALHIQLQVLSGLAEAHDLMIVHRDLKPSNIMLTRKGAHRDLVKIVDFGIGKALGESEDSSVQDLTGPIGDAMGSPLYMAPELLKNEHIGPHCDVYAAGLILAEMLTGEKSFDADTIPAIMAKQIYNDVPMPPWLASSPLAPFIRKATAKNWKERYATALDFHEALALVDPKTIDAPAVAEVPLSASGEAMSLSDVQPASDIVASRLPQVGAPPLPPAAAASPTSKPVTASAGAKSRTAELLARLKPGARKASTSRKESHLPAPVGAQAAGNGDDTDDERPAMALPPHEAAVDDGDASAAAGSGTGEGGATLVSPLYELLSSASVEVIEDDPETETLAYKPGPDGALPDFDTSDEEPDTAVGRPSGKASQATSSATREGDDASPTLLRSMPEDEPSRRRWGIIVAAVVVVVGVLVALLWGPSLGSKPDGKPAAATVEPEKNALAELVEAEAQVEPSAAQVATPDGPRSADPLAAAGPEGASVPDADPLTAAGSDDALVVAGADPTVPPESEPEDLDDAALDAELEALGDLDADAVEVPTPTQEPTAEDLAFLEALEDSEPARVTWSFASSPPGARVVRVVGDVELCAATPCDVAIEATAAEVEVVFVLAAHLRHTVTVAGGEGGELSVELEKSPAKARKPRRRGRRHQRRGGVDPFDVRSFD